MQHARPPRIIALAITTALMIVAMVALVGVVAAAPPPSLVAQATAGPIGSASAPVPTTVSGTVAPGASAVSSPAIPATAATASDVAAPSALPPVDTGSGPDRGTVIETLIGIAVAVVIVPLGAVGLIRLIANAGRP